MAIRHMKRFSTLLIPHVGIYLEKSKILIRKDTRTPMFIAALFTIAKTWKHSKCSSTDEWIKKLLYIYRMEYLFSHKKDHIWVSPNEVDESRAYHTECSKSEREKHISYTNACIRNLEMVLMNLFAHQLWRHRHWEQTYGHSWVGEGEWEIWRE